MVRIAKKIGVPPAQVALSWIADRPSVIAPIVGARTVEHLRSNLGAAELTLDKDATETLRRSAVHSLAAILMDSSANGSVDARYRTRTMLLRLRP